ncbi:MAG: transposase [Sphingomonadales bacterium]
MILPNTVYHIYNHANGRDNLFAESENYRYFLALYGKYIGPVAETYAFCLMPNHFHFLLRTRGCENLPGLRNLEGLDAEGAKIKERFFSQQFSNFFKAYSKAFNKKYNRRGSLFQKNVRRKTITSESYFLRLFAYIHQNPVRHGFTPFIDEWQASSYGLYFKHNPLPWLNTEMMENRLQSIEEFRMMHHPKPFRKSV